MIAKPNNKGSFKRELTGWGDLLTGDHLIGRKGETGALTDDKDALTLKDVWSDLKHCYPMPNKSYEETYDAIQHFSNGRPVKLWYSDGSGELEKAVRHLAIPYDRSAAGVSQNNAIA